VGAGVDADVDAGEVEAVAPDPFQPPEPGGRIAGKDGHCGRHQAAEIYYAQGRASIFPRVPGQDGGPREARRARNANRPAQKGAAIATAGPHASARTAMAAKAAGSGWRSQSLRQGPMPKGGAPPASGPVKRPRMVHGPGLGQPEHARPCPGRSIRPEPIQGLVGRLGPAAHPGARPGARPGRPFGPKPQSGFPGLLYPPSGHFFPHSSDPNARRPANHPHRVFAGLLCPAIDGFICHRFDGNPVQSQAKSLGRFAASLPAPGVLFAPSRRRSGWKNARFRSPGPGVGPANRGGAPTADTLSPGAFFAPSGRRSGMRRQRLRFIRIW
jgi:hypothetical protein